MKMLLRTLVPYKRKVKKSSTLEVAKKASEDQKEAEMDAA
jgi:hypothetical protein